MYILNWINILNNVNDFKILKQELYSPNFSDALKSFGIRIFRLLEKINETENKLNNLKLLSYAQPKMMDILSKKYLQLLINYQRIKLYLS